LVRLSFVLFMIFMVQEGPTRFTMKGMKAMKGRRDVERQCLG